MSTETDQPVTIHLSTNLTQSTIWSMPDSRLRVWIHLLLRVARVPREVVVEGRRFSLKRGELVGVESELASEASVSKETYRRALSDLEADDSARIKITRALGKGRIRVALLNYDAYQIPCVPVESGTLDTPKPAKRTKEREPRVGATAWADDKRDRARARNISVAGKIRLAVAAGENRREAKIRIIGQVWGDAGPSDWIGMYDLYYESCIGFRSAEIVGATRRKLTARVARIASMLQILRTWGESTTPVESPQGLLADYLAWVFRGERLKTERVLKEGGKVRTPITLDQCFDPSALNRWNASRRVTTK